MRFWNVQQLAFSFEGWGSITTWTPSLFLDMEISLAPWPSKREKAGCKHIGTPGFFQLVVRSVDGRQQYKHKNEKAAVKNESKAESERLGKDDHNFRKGQDQQLLSDKQRQPQHHDEKIAIQEAYAKHKKNQGQRDDVSRTFPCSAQEKEKSKEQSRTGKAKAQVIPFPMVPAPGSASHGRGQGQPKTH
jgi:hypothetical protein